MTFQFPAADVEVPEPAQHTTPVCGKTYKSTSTGFRVHVDAIESLVGGGVVLVQYHLLHNSKDCVALVRDFCSHYALES